MFNNIGIDIRNVITYNSRVKRSLLLPQTMDKWLKTVKVNESKLNENDSSVTAAETVAMASCSSSNFNDKKTAEASKKRKYDESYLSFVFTWIGVEEEPNGLCVECGTVLSNGSLFPAKLKRHLEAKHSQLKKKKH